MIDYTQYAFRNPVSVVDPIPTVADYLTDYRAQDAAWYDQWAYPIGPGQWGARPESFEVRGQWTQDLLPETALPPILRETGGNLATGEVGMGSTRTRPEDRPVGSMAVDPEGMSNDELWDTWARISSPAAEFGAAAPGTALGLVTGVPGLGLMGRQGMLDYQDRVSREMERRVMESLALNTALPGPARAINPNVTIARVGTPSFSEDPGRDVIDQLVLGPDVGPPMFERVGTGTTGPSGGQSDADRSDDRGYGGGSEVGAGGWAGSGGL